jgi:polyhydroxybutyrate depolymerase
LQTLIGIVLLVSSTKSAFCETNVTVDAGRGDVAVYLPDTYDSEMPLPLIVALHGFTSSSEIIKNHWRLIRLVDEKNFVLCIPDGTKNSRGQRFWNATDACCDFENDGVDDSTYLRSLVELLEANYAIDPKSIHFMGHSNGGFMSLRMACDHADKIASVQSLAGAMFLDTEEHIPSEPVHVLQVHGTKDKSINYDGGCRENRCYPSARKTVAMWAEFNQCNMVPKQIGTIDIVTNVEGKDTTVIRFESKEPTDAGAVAELWTIHGGSHNPRFNHSYSPRIVDWSLAHRKQD